MLTWQKFWLLLGWILIFSVCYLSVTVSPPDFGMTFEYSDKLKHIFAYFVLMGWFAQIYKTTYGRLFYAAFFVLMGVTLEIIQGLGQARYFEYADMLANTIGVALAWLATQGSLKDILLTIERIARDAE